MNHRTATSHMTERRKSKFHFASESKIDQRNHSIYGIIIISFLFYSSRYDQKRHTKLIQYKWSCPIILIAHQIVNSCSNTFRNGKSTPPIRFVRFICWKILCKKKKKKNVVRGRRRCAAYWKNASNRNQSHRITKNQLISSWNHFVCQFKNVFNSSRHVCIRCGCVCIAVWVFDSNFQQAHRIEWEKSKSKLTNRLQFYQFVDFRSDSGSSSWSKCIVG